MDQVEAAQDRRGDELRAASESAGDGQRHDAHGGAQSELPRVVRRPQEVEVAQNHADAQGDRSALKTEPLASPGEGRDGGGQAHGQEQLRALDGGDDDEVLVGRQRERPPGSGCQQGEHEQEREAP